MTETERKTSSPGRRFSILTLLGILLILVSLVGIHFGPDLLQYAFLPALDSKSISPQVPHDSSDAESSMEEEDTSSDVSSRSSAGSDTSAVSSPARDALDHYATLISGSVWAGESPVMTLQGQKSHTSVSRPSGTSVGDVRLLFAGPRFFEVYPEKLMDGRGISDAEVRRHSLSAVLDSRVAFSLFGDLSPLGEKVEISGSEYTVIGVIQHHRSLGSSDVMTVWIPLGADAGLTPDLLTVSVRHARASDGFTTLWRSETENVFGSGTFISLPREKSRASLLPRLLVFFFAVLWMKKWILLIRSWGRLWIADAKQRMVRQYAFSLTVYFILRILAALLIIAFTLAAMYALAVFITEPLLIFPEWVPEKPVALSSILARFWYLIGENATYLNLVTEQAAILRFWHFLIRLGTFIFLLGLLKVRIAPHGKTEK